MEIYEREAVMRKLRIINKELSNDTIDRSPDSPSSEEIQKEINFILIISWIIPFFGTFFLYLARKKLFEKPKSILCKINNLNFTVVLVNFILVSILQPLVLAKAPAIAIYILMLIITGIFIYGFISHVIATLRWWNGKDFSYKFVGEFFKPYENLK